MAGRPVMRSICNNMNTTICFLGFSRNYLALAFNSLRENGHTGAVKIIKNVDVPEEDIPFDCGLDYEIVEAEAYRREPEDRYLFAVSGPLIKRKIYESFLQSHQINREAYINLVHHSVQVGQTTELNGGIYIEPGTVLAPYSKIGFGATINRSVSVGHHTQIGDFSTLNPGTHIAGQCQVGTDCAIGIGSVIFDRLSVGARSVVGGGSVVTKDIPASVLAYGSPCRPVKQLS